MTTNPSLTPLREAAPSQQHTPFGRYSTKGNCTGFSGETEDLEACLADSRHYAHQTNLDLDEFGKTFGLTTPSVALVEKCRNALLEKDLLRHDGWNPAMSSAREADLYVPLKGIFNTICSLSSQEPYQSRSDATGHPSQYSLQYVATDTNLMKLRDSPPGIKRHPDLCMMLTNGDHTPSSNRTISWHDVILPLEIKKKGKKEEKVELQSAAQAKVLLTAQNCRLYCFSMTIAFPRCTLYLWDRSGYLSSSSFDMETTTGIPKLIAIIIRFSQMSLKDHGFDPTAFTIQHSRLYPPLRLPIYIRYKQGRIFRLDERITPYSDLFGKETRCWNATECSMDDANNLVPMSKDPQFIVKESWLHDEVSNDPGVAASPVPEDFTAAVVIDNTWSTPGMAVNEVPRQFDMSDGYEGGLYRFLGNIPGLAEFIGAEKLESTFRNIRNSIGPGEELSRSRNRVILNTVGKALRLSKTPQALLQAILDIVDVHEQLCLRGVLHRDVSDSNCLIRVSTGRGFLTDLDHAIDMTRLAQLVAQRRRHRTGTMTFMAVGLLTEYVEPHNWTHDYESIFWLLLWICAGSPLFGPGKLLDSDPNFRVLELFYHRLRMDARRAKKEFLYDSRPKLEQPITHPRFQPLAKCLLNLQTLFYQHRRILGEPREPLTRAAFREVLVRWISLTGRESFDDGEGSQLSDGGRYRPQMKHIRLYTPFTSQSTTSLSLPSSSSTSGSEKRNPEETDDHLSARKKPKTVR